MFICTHEPLHSQAAMKLTHTEARVVPRLRKTRVDTMRHLYPHLQVSHMSVVRALNKYGDFTSANPNARYYTLHDIPRFDENGLWTDRDICFSSRHTLGETLVALVHNAAAGLPGYSRPPRLSGPPRACLVGAQDSQATASLSKGFRGNRRRQYQ
ncbi:MAG: hypothetical protein ACQESR_05665 [Planctomycetota bacterium]